jgi:hypothetical protein
MPFAIFGETADVVSRDLQPLRSISPCIAPFHNCAIALIGAPAFHVGIRESVSHSTVPAAIFVVKVTPTCASQAVAGELVGRDRERVKKSSG